MAKDTNKKAPEVATPTPPEFPEVEIKWTNITMSLVEGVSSGTEFAWANEKGEQCMPFVHCKDYLQDAYHCTHNKKAMTVWGFGYKPEEHPPVDMDHSRILVRHPRMFDYAEKLPNTIDLLNQIEADFKFKPTIAQRVSNPPKEFKKCGIFMLVGDCKWLLSSPQISLLALLARIGPGHTAGVPWRESLEALQKNSKSLPRTGDSSHIKQASPGILRLAKHTPEEVWHQKPAENFASKIGIGVMHNMGIVNYTTGQYTSTMPHWYRKEIMA